MKFTFVLLLSIPLIFACKNDKQDQHAAVSEDMGAPPSENRDVLVPTAAVEDTVVPEEKPVDSTSQPLEQPEPIPKRSEMVTSAPSSTSPSAGLRGSVAVREGFVDMQQMEPSIRLEIRYATTNNFTESKIYDCARCLLRPETARALVKAHRLLQRQGLGLKLFDCYRPQPYQQRLWDKVPDPDYVTPPEKGSMHSRGAAVDLTIVDNQGKELDMGTTYDFFGPEAHYSYFQLPAKVLENRRLLRRVMEDVGLKGIRTEWWHFSYQRKSFPLSNWVWECRD